MKVMCIINEPWEVGVGPSFSEEVTAYESPAHENFYKLIEYPHEYSYNKKYFIPLSDQDETELIRERKTETA
jgi:hypothetical protein